jgi:transcriptional regulator with XRE-family HTH domain
MKNAKDKERFIANLATDAGAWKFAGRRLREVRVNRGLSEGEVADRSGLARAYISRVECGHTVPMIATLARWTDALEISLSQFFSEWVPQPRPERDLDRCMQLARRMDKENRALWYRLGVTLLRFKPPHK